MKIYLLLFSLIVAFNTSAQTLMMHVPDNNFGLDESNTLILSQLENIASYSNTHEYDEIHISLGQNTYYFNAIPEKISYSSSYLITNQSTSKQYTLYFTQLPIVLIETDNLIVDEPKVLAQLTYTDAAQTLTSNIGIELRGGSSKYYPKKNYDIEFWEDEFGDDTNNEQFGSLRNDDDWILDALYNEPLRLRSFVANKLWQNIHSEANYIDSEPDAKTGVGLMYVEVFIKGQYNGIYNLSEQIDRKQLKLKSFDNAIKGELYKGITWGNSTFTSLPIYDNTSRIWDGYEYKYPEKSDTTNWETLYQFTDFVMNSSETDFKNNIWSKFDKENYIDYFLFLNLIRATDNTGKNIYLGKYDINSPYFYVPWDLDGCFGSIWDGTNENISNGILSNGLFDRVMELNPEDINTTLANKWFEYRNTILDNEELSNLITERYQFLQTNKVYERESLVYANYSFGYPDLSYTLNWLNSRLAYLDIYFGNLLNIPTTDNKLLLYPNPANHWIYISTKESIQNMSYNLYDNTGHLILEGIIEDNFISIKNIKDGVYFMQVGSYTAKFIKE